MLKSMRPVERNSSTRRLEAEMSLTGICRMGRESGWPQAITSVWLRRRVSPGKLTQKIGTVSVEEKSANVQPATSQQLSALQAQAIGPVEENSSWKIAGDDEPQTPTVIAHDSTDGQMIRGRGLRVHIGGHFKSRQLSCVRSDTKGKPREAHTAQCDREYL